MTTDGLIAAGSGTMDPDTLVAEMFARESTSLVRLASFFCDDRNASEDLVQEAFIRLHRSAGSVRDMDRAPAYLRSIVINLARDHNRRGLMSLRHRNASQPTTTPPGPDDRAIADDESLVVLAALRGLPDRQRACLVLHYHEEMSIAEVADTMRISKNSVKTHCRRGLATLESRLKESA